MLITKKEFYIDTNGKPHDHIDKAVTASIKHEINNVAEPGDLMLNNKAAERIVANAPLVIRLLLESYHGRIFKEQTLKDEFRREDYQLGLIEWPTPFPCNEITLDHGEANFELVGDNIVQNGDFSEGAWGWSDPVQLSCVDEDSHSELSEASCGSAETVWVDVGEDGIDIVDVTITPYTGGPFD